MTPAPSLTREDIERIDRNAQCPGSHAHECIDQIVPLCAMALRSLDSDARCEALEAGTASIIFESDRLRSIADSLGETIARISAERDALRAKLAPWPVPAGCVCDPGTWGNPASIRPACAKFVGGAGQYCETCEHDEACHELAARAKSEEAK